MAGHQHLAQPFAVACVPYGRRRRTERRHADADALSGICAPIALGACRWRHIGGRRRTGQDVLAPCIADVPPQDRTISRPHPTYYATTGAFHWLKDTQSSRLLIEGGVFAVLLVAVGSPVGSCPRQSRARRIGARPAAVARVACHHRRFRAPVLGRECRAEESFPEWFAPDCVPDALPQSHRATRDEA